MVTHGNSCKNPTFAVICKPCFTVNMFPTGCFMKHSVCPSHCGFYRSLQTQRDFQRRIRLTVRCHWDLFNLSGKLVSKINKMRFRSAKPLWFTGESWSCFLLDICWIGCIGLISHITLFLKNNCFFWFIMIHKFYKGSIRGWFRALTLFPQRVAVWFVDVFYVLSS